MNLSETLLKPEDRWRAHPSVIAVALLLVVCLSGVLWLRRERAKTYRVPILMYHKIGTQPDSPWWVSEQDFEEHLNGLREEGFTSILPSDLAAHVKWGKSLPARPVIITFDDGFLNCLQHAEPLLARYGFRAVTYLITGSVSDTPETRRSFEDTPLLSWPEVREMHRRGTIVFGSHTRSHVNLAAAANPWDDIRGSYRDIRKKGGFQPDGLCYPYGEYRPSTLPLVAKAGFTTAMTCHEDVARAAPDTRLLELPRVSVMGGWHRWHVSSTNGPDPKTIVVRMSKEGRPLLVRARLTWPEPGAREVTEAAPAVLVGETPVTASFRLSPPQQARPAIVELWDPSLVVRYTHIALGASAPPAP